MNQALPSMHGGSLYASSPFNDWFIDQERLQLAGEQSVRTRRVDKLIG